MSGGEADLINECLGDPTIDGIPQKQGGSGVWDVCAITGNDKGPVSSGR